MQIITEPTVHVLAIPYFFPHPKYELPDRSPVDSKPRNHLHDLIAHAGKGCYDSYGKDGRSIEEHIKTLIETQHSSVLEHVHISLFIEGISRGCSHEIVRHRHFNYSQRSTRYTNENDAAIVLDPFYTSLHIAKSGNQSEFYEDMYDQFINSCESSLRNYSLAVEQLLEVAEGELQGKSKIDKRKWARGKARQLLPHALETRMTMTGNLRAWRFFLEERSAPFAEPEIRRLSNVIFNTLNQLAPLVFQDYKPVMINDYNQYVTPFRKI